MTETLAAPTLLSLRGVTKTYEARGRNVVALAGIDLDIRAGDFITIQGPTGGGKSTLLQLLGALDSPSSGSLRVGDVDDGRKGSQ